MAKNFLHVDPARQRDFITQLNTRVHNIENLVKIIDSRMGMLGREWRDAEFDEFKASLVKTIQVLDQFVVEGRKLSGKLSAAADLGEDYQRIRQ